MTNYRYFDEGYEAAMLSGSHSPRCPYDETSKEGFEWTCGYWKGMELLFGLKDE